MTSAADERAHWTRLACLETGWSSMTVARESVWSEAGTEAWETGVLYSMGQIVPAIASKLRRGNRVLDLGCGIGRLALPVANLCPTAELVGVDVSPAMVEIACEERDAQKHRNERVTFVIGNGRDVDGLGPFDAAYSMLVFQHLDADAVRSYLRSVAEELDQGAPFRFQWTVDGDDADYHHQHDPLDMHEWCAEAGFTRGLIEADPQYPTWRWQTVRRR